MRHSSFVLVSFLLVAVALAQDEPTASPNDYLFIRGKVAGCEIGLHTVDYAKVDEQGQVEVLGVTLDVSGKTAPQITSELADSLEHRTGQWPATLEVVWVPDADQEQIAKRLLMIAKSTRRACRQFHKPMDPVSAEDIARIALR